MGLVDRIANSQSLPMQHRACAPGTGMLAHGHFACLQRRRRLSRNLCAEVAVQRAQHLRFVHSKRQTWRERVCVCVCHPCHGHQPRHSPAVNTLPFTPHLLLVVGRSEVLEEQAIELGPRSLHRLGGVPQQLLGQRQQLREELQHDRLRAGPFFQVPQNTGMKQVNA